MKSDSTRKPDNTEGRGGGGRVVTDLLGRGEVAAAGGLSLKLSPPHGGGGRRQRRERGGRSGGVRLSCTRAVEALNRGRNRKPYLF